MTSTLGSSCGPFRICSGDAVSLFWMVGFGAKKNQCEKLQQAWPNTFFFFKKLQQLVDKNSVGFRCHDQCEKGGYEDYMHRPFSL